MANHKLLLGFGALSVTAVIDASATNLSDIDAITGYQHLSNVNGIGATENAINFNKQRVGLNPATTGTNVGNGAQYHHIFKNVDKAPGGTTGTITASDYPMMDAMMPGALHLDPNTGEATGYSYDESSYGVGQLSWCQAGTCAGGSGTSIGWNHTANHILFSVSQASNVTITLANGPAVTGKHGPNESSGVLGGDLKPAFTLYSGASTTGVNDGNHTFNNTQNPWTNVTYLDHEPNTANAASITWNSVNNGPGVLAPGYYSLWIGGNYANVANSDGSHGKNYRLSISAAPPPTPTPAPATPTPAPATPTPAPATPTPAPATPTPAPATPTPAPATPTPAPSATPAPSTSPSPSPSASPNPSPTASPAPSASPSPSPSASPTPGPSATPEPSASPTPTPGPTDSPTLEVTGSGDGDSNVGEPISLLVKSTDPQGQAVDVSATLDSEAVAELPGDLTDTVSSALSDSGEESSLNTLLATAAATTPSLPTSGDSNQCRIGHAVPLLVIDAQGNALFKWTPTADDAGPHTLVFKATDTDGFSTEETVTLNVKALPQENRAPQFDWTAGWYAANPGKQLKIRLQAQDPDGDKVRFYINKGPEGAQVKNTFFNKKTGKWEATWVYTPDRTEAGNTYKVYFTATDDKPGESKQTTRWTYVHVNEPKRERDDDHHHDKGKKDKD